MFDKFLCKYIHKKKITVGDVLDVIFDYGLYIMLGICLIILSMFYLFAVGELSIFCACNIGVISKSSYNIITTRLSNVIICGFVINIAYGVIGCVLYYVCKNTRKIQIAECPLNKE